MAMTKAKQNLLELKDTLGLQNNGILDTDLMQLINKAWERSFARVDKNKNAISVRGWNPLNRALLLDPLLRSTMTANEKSDTYNQVNNIIIPNKDSKKVTDGDPSISTETTSDHSSTNNLPNCDNLNFLTGMSSFCLKAYLTNEQLQQGRESIRIDMNTEKSMKEQLKESTRLSVGIIFKAESL